MLRFISSSTPPERLEMPAFYFIFSGNHLLIHEEETAVSLPRLTRLTEEMPFLSHHLLSHTFLGTLEDDASFPCFAAEVPRETTLPDGLAFVNLRQLYGRISDEELTLAGRALQIIDWERTHKYCSRCGAPAQSKPGEHVKICTECDFTMYPRLAPAIIVRVQREGDNGREILLARGHHYPSGWYSVLAGFVEPGEDLETCVAREIFEEVGIRVKNIQYFGSQPWPFPHSLMLGFTADYESGELKLQEDEIEDAKWFSPKEMPRIPPRMSISRHLIDDFLEQNKA